MQIWPVSIAVLSQIRCYGKGKETVARCTQATFKITKEEHVLPTLEREPKGETQDPEYQQCVRRVAQMYPERAARYEIVQNTNTAFSHQLYWLPTGSTPRRTRQRNEGRDAIFIEANANGHFEFQQKIQAYDRFRQGEIH